MLELGREVGFWVPSGAGAVGTFFLCGMAPASITVAALVVSTMVVLDATATRGPISPQPHTHLFRYPMPVLRTRAVDITEFNDDLAEKAKQMFSVMYACRGVGLAAPQVKFNCIIHSSRFSRCCHQPSTLTTTP